MQKHTVIRVLLYFTAPPGCLTPWRHSAHFLLSHLIYVNGTMKERMFTGGIGMWGMAAIQIGIILLFLLFGWAIRRGKAYWLISGFSSRPKEEQEEMIRNGYPQKTGTLMLATAIGMLL